MGPLIRTHGSVFKLLARSSCSRRVWLVNDVCEVLTSQGIDVGGGDWNFHGHRGGNSLTRLPSAI